MSVNKVILLGRLGKDPVIRYTQGGQSVANFSIATDEFFKDKQGEKQKKTEWHNIVVWGKLVENVVEKYLHQGDAVYLEGRIQSRVWEDKEGGQRTAFEIVVTDIRLLPNKQAETPVARPAAHPAARPAPAAGRPAARPATRPTPAPEPEEAQGYEGTDEDIPF